ncbi:helicase HerA domain-containing protein [Candidatus Halobonum tyrrellensis]|uniref:Uncharacterized protein n=1 Tax=Candidatus Halobonum tyrrellensis G22 TaxID=1324957 RepID=V4IX24_9EURY|nr:DUF87 domain-containing protein [Candidatus Halobonum tyrrellensis]ESP87732.1 hypothetical protein K933_12615 [Candidatus Halobonum tyrrellensis G22]
MSESDETIAVADVSDGTGGESDLDPGTTISLPVVELLTGRGFITGKSGSGKSNTASVVIENLLDNNFPVLIVDSDGEYYGLKQEYEILHAGADEECDIQVSAEHADKLASLALEQNVPIILDVSGYLEEGAASNLIRETARHLFAKEKKLKKPFLMLVEECHEYIPEGAGMDATGKTLIKIGKRGRKHGLGIVGISQRPADVKKDFITQCDWLCWHRLTWDNDTKVVGRILGSEYADAIEDMDDGEAFMVTDWEESVRRVQFHRKQTFDAGATPGLEDFERPDLKSVSGDLVSELRDITDEQERRESKLADLEQELDRKNQRITQLERELEEAKDMSRMADKFAQALLSKSEATYRGGSGRNLAREEAEPGRERSGADDRAPEPRRRDPPRDDADQSGLADYAADSPESEEDAGDPDEVDGDAGAWPDPTNGAGAGAGAGADDATPANTAATDGSGHASADAAGGTDAPSATAGSTRTGVDISEARSPGGFDGGAGLLAAIEDDELRGRETVVRTFVGALDSLEDVSRGMLAHYRAAGPTTPRAAHRAAGGSGDRTFAYGRNRRLRSAGLVEHRAHGEYDYALASLVRRAYAGGDEQAVADVVAEIEARAGLDGE